MRSIIRPLISIASADITYGFSYFALISILVLCLSYHTGLSLKETYSIYGIFVFLTYAMPVFGGIIGDYLLDWRHCITIGMLMVAASFILIGMNKNHIATGLGIFITGEALLKPNASSLLGLLYQNGLNHKKDHGFTTVYALMNIGAILGPIVTGILTHLFGFGDGFIICGILLISMWLIYVGFWSALPIPKQYRYHSTHPGIRCLYFTIAIMAIASICIATLRHYHWNHIVLSIFILSTCCYFILQILRCDKQQRYYYIALIILLFFSTIFFTAELQVGSSLLMFIEHNLHPYIAIPSSTYASLLALAVAIGAITMKPITRTISKKSNYISYQVRCALAMLLTVISYLIFYAATYSATNAYHYIVLILVILGNLFLGFGEVLIAPIVTSAVTSLTPPSKHSTFMGINFMMVGISGYLASILAQISTNGHATTHFDYGKTFLIITCFATTGLVLTLILTPLMKRLVQTAPSYA